MEIEFDPDKALSNLRKHRVSFAHAEQSLRDERAITIADPDAVGEAPRARPVPERRRTTMRKEYDFSSGIRGAVVPSAGKTRITIMLDNEVLDYFRTRAEILGAGYQTMINAALKSAVERTRGEEEPLTVAKLREVLRQELNAA